MVRCQNPGSPIFFNHCEIANMLTLLTADWVMFHFQFHLLLISRCPSLFKLRILPSLSLSPSLPPHYFHIRSSYSHVSFGISRVLPMLFWLRKQIDKERERGRESIFVFTFLSSPICYYFSFLLMFPLTNKCVLLLILFVHEIISPSFSLTHFLLSISLTPTPMPFSFIYFLFICSWNHLTLSLSQLNFFVKSN